MRSTQKILLTTLLIVLSVISFESVQSQSEDTSITSTHIYYVVDNMPEFPGGEAAMHKFIEKNMEYPVEAKRMGIEGVVFVKFIVSASGKIEENSVEIAGSLHPILDEEAKRIVKKMPAWSVPTHQGKPVPVYMKTRITFMLR